MSAEAGSDVLGQGTRPVSGEGQEGQQEDQEEHDGLDTGHWTLTRERSLYGLNVLNVQNTDKTIQPRDTDVYCVY